MLDLIFAFGSGFMRGTSVDEHMTPVNRDYPLCRTQQILLCVGLVMTRQVIYDSFIRREPLEQMPMNEFEERVLKCTDIQRLVSETMQLENYLFRQPKPEPKREEEEQKMKPDEKLNDLDLAFDCLPQLAAHVREARSANIRQQQGFRP